MTGWRTTTSAGLRVRWRVKTGDWRDEHGGKATPAIARVTRATARRGCGYRTAYGRERDIAAQHGAPYAHSESRVRFMDGTFTLPQHW